MKIQEQKNIQTLLEKVYKTNPYVLIFYPIKNQSYFFNGIAKLTHINKSKNTLTFLAEDDREILKSKKTFLLNTTVKSCFILDELRYTFESKLIDILETSKCIFQLMIEVPDIMDYRKNRKYPRVSEKKMTLSKNIKFWVKDISVGGMGLVAQKSESNVSEGANLKIKVGVPYLSETTSLYQFLTLNMKCVRRETYQKNYELIGLEFEKLNTFDESIIYQYMISRKNEILFQTHELLPIKCDIIANRGSCQSVPRRRESHHLM